MMNVAIISARGAEHVDFDAVSRAARGSIEHIVRHLLPDARRQGHAGRARRAGGLGRTGSGVAGGRHERRREPFRSSPRGDLDPSGRSR